MSYKIRVTTTVQQLDHDGRILFSLTDTVDESSLGHGANYPDQPGAFARGMSALCHRMKAVMTEHYFYDRNATA